MTKHVMTCAIVLACSMAIFACERASERPAANAYPVGMTHATAAEVPQPEAWLSPGLQVEGAVAKRCGLHRDDVEAAPHFGFDSSALQPEDQDVLLQLAKCVTSGPLAGRKLVLARADDATLAERVMKMQKYLLEYGVSADHVDATTTTKVEGAGAHRIHVDVAR